MFALPTVQADDRLATLLDTYIGFLTCVADPVAPRLTTRMAGFTKETPAFHSAAELFYHAHITAAALVALHAAYTGTVGVLESNDTPEVMRERLAPFFARPDSVFECIGSATPNDLFPADGLLEFARARARALGLTKFGGGLVYRALPQDVVGKVNKLLAAGPQLVEMFNMADTVADFNRLLRTVRKTSGLG